MLAADSTTEQYSPPWTTPHGVCWSGPRSTYPVTRVPVASVTSNLIAATNGLAAARSTDGSSPLIRSPRWRSSTAFAALLCLRMSSLDRSYVPHQAEGVSHRVGVDAEVAALAGQSLRAQGEHLG